MEVFRVTNPDVLNVSMFDDFLQRAFPEDSLMFPSGYAARKDRMVRIIKDPNFALFIGWEDNKLSGLSLVFAPDDVDLIRPQFSLFYSEGSSKIKAALLDAGIEFIKSKGHMEAWGVNGTDKPDSVWARTFRRVGNWSRVGSIMKVEFKK